MSSLTTAPGKPTCGVVETGFVSRWLAVEIRGQRFPAVVVTKPIYRQPA
jgi:hypothetical protein